MAYNDTPLPGQAKNAIQPEVRENFQILQAYLAANHDDIAVNSAPAFGKHTTVQLDEQAAVPVAADNQIILYGALNATTAQTELIARRTDMFDRQENIRMSASTKAVKGWAYLFSGLLIKWGTTTVNFTGDTYIVYATEVPTAPVFTEVFTAQVSIYGAGGADLNTAVRVTRYADDVTRMRIFVSHRYTAGAASGRLTWFALGRYNG